MDDIESVGPLSFCQELILLNSLRDPDFRPLIAEAVELTGEIDPERICRALGATIGNHPTLRTRYLVRDGASRAEVLAKAPDVEPITLLDVRESSNCAQRIRQAIKGRVSGLEPGRGEIVGSVLARTGAASWLWMLAIHHLASDGWSQYIYGRFFSATLRRSGGAARLASSIDYVTRQKAWFSTEAAQVQLEWWITMAGTLSAQPLPIRPRVSHNNEQPVLMRVERRVEANTHKALHLIARAARVPMLAATFAIFAKTVARRTGGAATSVVSLVGGRTLEGADKATGAFYNSIILTLDTRSAPDERSLLNAAAAAVFQGWRRQEVPLGLVFEACGDRGRYNIMDKLPITFNFIRHPLAEFRIPGCRMGELDSDSLEPVGNRKKHVRVMPNKAKHLPDTMTVVVCDLAHELRVTLDCPGERFDRPDVEDFLEEYINDVESFTARLGTKELPAPRRAGGLIYSETGDTSI